MNKVLAFVGTLLGVLSAIVALLDFGWSANISVQNLMIILTTVRFEVLLLLFLLLIVFANNKFKFLNFNPTLSSKKSYIVGAFIFSSLVVYGSWVGKKIERNLGPESVLKMAENGRYLQAASRARHLSELEKNKEYKLELIKFEQSMISKDILAKAYEKSYVDSISNLSEEDADQRRDIGRNLIDPTNTLYENEE